MSVSDAVLATRQSVLKSIFEQHSAYLNSRWYNDEHFTVQTRMLEPGPRWRKEPPASFLMMLLRDRELANFQTPPGYHGLLSQVSSSKFQEIVDWLHAVLFEGAAQQEARPFEESHSFSQVPEALPFPISAQSGIRYSPTAPGRSITETIGSLPSTPPYQGTISFSMEDPRAVIQRILHPVSHYLNIWACANQPRMTPCFRLPVSQCGKGIPCRRSWRSLSPHGRKHGFRAFHRRHKVHSVSILLRFQTRAGTRSWLHGWKQSWFPYPRSMKKSDPEDWAWMAYCPHRRYRSRSPENVFLMGPWTRRPRQQT
jgi:hypothetical protein